MPRLEKDCECLFGDLSRFAFRVACVMQGMEKNTPAQLTDAVLEGRFGLPGPPAIMFFNAAGEELKPYRVVGFKPAQEFADHVGRAIP